MAAYNWIVILLALGFFGLLYASTYDVVADAYSNSYKDSSDAALGAKIMWLSWKYSPVVCLLSLFIYGVMAAQKTGGGFN